MSEVIIERLPANRAGRDFYVGDLHGCHQLLGRALLEVEFQPDVDRVIAVGDLVDRGPQSLDCLGLLERPWFHSVRGNHEDLMLRSAAYFHGDRGAARDHELHLMNGGDWCRDYRYDDDFWFAVDRVKGLPHVLVVGEGEQRRNVVHAELPDGTTDGDIDAGLPGVTPAELMWSRRIMGADAPLPRKAEGLSPTVCGHTPGAAPRLRLSHLCIDTGAFFSGRLTVTEVAA